MPLRTAILCLINAPGFSPAQLTLASEVIQEASNDELTAHLQDIGSTESAATLRGLADQLHGREPVPMFEQ